MRVATFLHPGQVPQMKAALDPRDELCIAESWHNLETLIRLWPLSVVVLNPAADGTLDVTTACNFIRKYASIPIVAYVPLDATLVHCIASMSHAGLQHVILARSDDSPMRFRETLGVASVVQEIAALVQRLQMPLQRLPRLLREVLVDALRLPHKYARAEDIAVRAELTLSGLYRSFRGAGLTSPKNFVVGAKAFRGYLYLRDPALSIRDVSLKLGYTDQRIFARQIECVFGELPSVIRHSLTTEQSVNEVVCWFTRTQCVA